MAKAAPAKKGSIKKGALVGKNKVCPKCGPGVYMAVHKDRVSCGKCGYTEFNKKE